MYIEKLASAIKNDIVSGLQGYHHNLSLNIYQLEDEIVQCRLSIINQLFRQGIAPIKDLLLSINCIKVDCKSLERCDCANNNGENKIAHFEIPQLVTEYGKNSIDYIGSIDRQHSFTVISSLSELKNIKYRKFGNKKPYVWIDYSPNENGMLDCFVFNAPFLQTVSITAVFKDPRQLKKYSCCNSDELLGPDTNYSYIDQLIKDKLTKEKLYYYRQAAAPHKPNNQQYSSGN